MRRWSIETVATFLVGVLVQLFAPQYIAWMCLLGALFLTFEALREVAKKEWASRTILKVNRKVGRPMSFLLVSLIGILLSNCYWLAIQAIIYKPESPKADTLLAPPTANQSGGPSVAQPSREPMIVAPESEAAPPEAPTFRVELSDFIVIAGGPNRQYKVSKSATRDDLPPENWTSENVSSRV